MSIILGNATLLSCQAIQIPSKYKNIYDYILTMYDTRSGRAKG